MGSSVMKFDEYVIHRRGVRSDAVTVEELRDLPYFVEESIIAETSTLLIYRYGHYVHIYHKTIPCAICGTPMNPEDAATCGCDGGRVLCDKCVSP
jgi:hypothetical protein